MSEIRDLLEEEIREELCNLSDLQTGSKEKSMAIENIDTLYKLKIEEARNELEFIEKCENRERDEQLKKEQLEEQTKERYFRIVAEAAGLLLPLMFYAVWMRRGFKFEETGTYTSTTFRGLFNRFKPTKK